jgi:hypothetical protein
MCKRRHFVLSAFFVCALMVCSQGSPCLKPQPPKYGVDLGTVDVSIPTIVPYAGKDENGHVIFDVFFLGRYKSGSDNQLHLFCREVDAATFKAFDVDLGCVEGILSDDTLYVWPHDPHGGQAATSHYPVRYVSNVPRGAPNASNKRVYVKGGGSGTGGVHVEDQS